MVACAFAVVTSPFEAHLQPHLVVVLERFRSWVLRSVLLDGDDRVLLGQEPAFVGILRRSLDLIYLVLLLLLFFLPCGSLSSIVAREAQWR
jgi:hypothetical protein